jgi:hypothetical protein
MGVGVGTRDGFILRLAPDGRSRIGSTPMTPTNLYYEEVIMEYGIIGLFVAQTVFAILYGILLGFVLDPYGKYSTVMLIILAVVGNFVFAFGYIQLFLI